MNLLAQMIRLPRRFSKKLTKHLLNELSKQVATAVTEQTILEMDPVKMSRVRLLAIGEPEPVMEMIQELHRLGFSEVAEWSIPLTFQHAPELPDGSRRIEITIDKHEIARIHNWRRHWLG